MNVNSIGSSLRYNPHNAPVKYGNGSFFEMLAAEQKLNEGVEEPQYVQVDATFPYGEKQILRADAIDDQGRRQSIRVEYAADSKPEDPVVIISVVGGAAMSAAYVTSTCGMPPIPRCMRCWPMRMRWR